MHRVSNVFKILQRNIHNETRSGTMAGLQLHSFQSENALGDAKGVLAGDESCKKGLIVIHEWWGMNEQIQQKGATLAKDGGFLVLVPDLYRGKVALDREEAGHCMAGLDWPGALKDISAAAKFLQSRGCARVGVTGFCMGGALSFAAAAACPEISAAAPFYGIPNPSLADLTTIRKPVQAHFGEKDDVKGFASPDDYLPLREKLVSAGVPLEFYTYDAGHAFTNSASPNYDKEASTLAFSRLYAFMQENLN